MDVRVLIVTFDEGIATEDRLNRQVQRNMEDLVRARRLNSPEETELVLQVLDDIQDQDKVKRRDALPRETREFEMEPLVGLHPAQIKGDR